MGGADLNLKKLKLDRQYDGRDAFEYLNVDLITEISVNGTHYTVYVGDNHVYEIDITDPYITGIITTANL